MLMKADVEGLIGAGSHQRNELGKLPHGFRDRMLDTSLEPCWTQARRYFQEELLANGCPIAREAIKRLKPLFAIKAKIHG